jgi:hypothetical protein
MFSKATLKKIVSAALNENDAIFFLDNNTCKKYKKYFTKHKVYSIENTKEIKEISKGNGTAIIFIESYNDTSILQANKVAKIFKDSEKYAKVFVLTLECGEVKPVPLYVILYFDVLITTNSTGVLQPQKIEDLIVIDVSQEIQQDNKNKQRLQKYRDKFFDFLGYPLSAMAHSFIFLVIISNLHDYGIIKTYNTSNVLTVMALSGCLLWILTQLSFVISNYVIKAYNSTTQTIEPSKMTATSKIGQVIEKILSFVAFIIIFPIISTIDLIITSVGIIDKLCLKVKSLFSIKKT